MTAFIVAPYSDRIEILSDTAQYTPDGVVVGFAEKVLTSDAVPLAIVGSGAVADIALIAQTIMAVAAKTSSVDATLKMLAGALSEIGKSPNLDTGLRIAIGAISETDGPVAYVFSSFNDPESSVGAFNLQRMGRAFAQGAAPTGEALVAYGPLSIQFGLEKDAVFMMDAMRRQKMVNPADPHRDPFYSVGGHIDMTIVRANGVTTKRLHTWPEDAVGRHIDPFKDAA